MKALFATALAVGLGLAAATPSFADCPGHVSAETRGKSVTTADTGPAAPPPVTTDRQG